MDQLKTSPPTPFRMLAFLASIFLCAASVCVAQNVLPNNERLQAGISLIKEGRFSEAEAAFKKATSENKTDGESWYYLGVVYVQLKDFKKAAVAFETAVRIR